MKCLFEMANQYVEESDWKTLAGLKICLCAMGVMIGLKVPRKKAGAVGLAAFSIFLALYVPLMWKMVKIWMQDCQAGQGAE